MKIKKWLTGAVLSLCLLMNTLAMPAASAGTLGDIVAERFPSISARQEKLGIVSCFIVVLFFMLYNLTSYVRQDKTERGKMMRKEWAALLAGLALLLAPACAAGAETGTGPASFRAGDLIEFKAPEPVKMISSDEMDLMFDAMSGYTPEEQTLVILSDQLFAIK